MLAAANALLLRGVITLDPVCVRTGVASTDDVVNMLANRALTAGKREGHEYHLNEVLGLLPNLQHGMDVNPKFTFGPTGVEYTTNLAAFDLLGVELLHGWLLDPQDLETVSVVENKTYNELIETLVHGNEAREAMPKLDAQLSEKEKMVYDKNIKSGDQNAENIQEPENTVGTDASDEGDNPINVNGEHREDGDNNVFPDRKDRTSRDQNAENIQEPENIDDTDASEEETNQSNGTEEQYRDKEGSSTNPDEENSETNDPNSPPKTTEANDSLQKEVVNIAAKISELSLQIARSEVANAFLSSSGHQLTYHGLEQLHKHMGDDALCAFFRNNHFATLTKHDGILYLLVTDLGYANTPEIVWEKLDNIDGDTEYANEFFKKPTPRGELKPATGPTIAPELLLAQRSQAESDYQLALAMSKGAATSQRMDDDEGKLIEAAKELSLKSYNGDKDAEVNLGERSNTTSTGGKSKIDSDLEVAMEYQRAQQQSEHESEQLARQLQELEYTRQRPAANLTRPARPASTAKAASASSNCVVS